MTVGRLQRYLEQLLDTDQSIDAGVVAHFKELARDRLGVSESEWRFLAEQVLEAQSQRFADEATRRDLAQFLAAEVKSGGTFWQPFLEFVAAIPGLANLLVEATLGQGRQIFKDGLAPTELIQEVQQEALPLNFRGTVSLVKLDHQNEDLTDIDAAIHWTVAAIDGFDFLSRPPEGHARNEHTILIKVWVNWGYFLYPSVASPQSVYAVARMCLAEADRRGAAVQVVIGDESGIEIALWGGSTMDNFRHTGIFQAGILAGLERATLLEADQPGQFARAGELLRLVQAGQAITPDPEDLDSVAMVELARGAGVRVMPFDGLSHRRIQVPDARHFLEGILVPAFVAEEVTDIINLPKPPGRHMIMGNTGLTGALKNHVGLLASEQRSPGLHGPYDRLPPPTPDQDGAAYLENLISRGRALRENSRGDTGRQFTLEVTSNWQTFAPGLTFHEKLVELYLAFAAKERFSVTDMRRTMSSIGPDLGDTVDIGAIIAARDPLTLDLFGGALLKRAYREMGGLAQVLEPGGDTLTEYLAGHTWLHGGTPFDLLSHIAANSYGVGPVDLDHIDLKGLEASGFTATEMEDILSFLRSGA